MDMEPESFRGGGGEAIGGRTGGPAYTDVDPAPLGFTGTSGACADRGSLYCMFITLFRFLLLAVALTILGVFVLGVARGGSVEAGLNRVRSIFGK
jgi:hypothetical protein